MFDTMNVAQKIREARNARNMTQMALADEMGVSYQAVSNWERGNSMPDISKLEQLCTVLHITIYELLGSDEKQSDTVCRMLRDDQLPEVEDVVEIAPIVPAEKIVEAAKETTKKRQVNWDTIIRVAPFLDSESLDEILENFEPSDYGRIVDLAPFVSRHTLEKLVCAGTGKLDKNNICTLAPFLGKHTLEKLMICYDGAVDRDLLAGVAPFLSSSTLDKLVFQNEGTINFDMEMVDHLAPFLSSATLDKLVERLIADGDPKAVSHLFPFLSRDMMRKLVKIMLDSGDFDAMREVAMFL